MSQQRSQGRGGAGNMSSRAPMQPESADLRTPTIKTSTYTTGRGGSGNMATNDPANPGQARAAQDVDVPAAISKEPKGTYHWGRGGEGNMVTVGSGAKEAQGENGVGGEAKQRQQQQSQPPKAQRSGSTSLFERGREMLGIKKEERKGAESAME